MIQNKTISSDSQLGLNEIHKSHSNSFDEVVKSSWDIIAPFWPLKNLIAVNPLQGFENLSIEHALVKGSIYFQQEKLPPEMMAVNRETIKWLQGFFDEGHATLNMPMRELGLYPSWKQLAVYDKFLHANQKEKVEWLKNLPPSSKEALIQTLSLLDITEEEKGDFLKLLLTTLPGWASYIKCQTDWVQPPKYPITQIDYLALRAITTYLLCNSGKNLLHWHRKVIQQEQHKPNPIAAIKTYEEKYRGPLLEKLSHQTLKHRQKNSAQLVFCIDVRSEPFRRAIESVGNYETFGFAGFFGIPTQIKDTITGESFSSCPALLSAKHEVNEFPSGCPKKVAQNLKGYERMVTVKKVYHSLKYTFSTPFALAEGLGFLCGAWLGLRTFAPDLSDKLTKITTSLIRRPTAMLPSLKKISFKDQCSYAENALRMIGLTSNFSPLVLFCGHGSDTQNNPYASALDCGACGGRHGSSNARVLAAILNQPDVRAYLAKKGLQIPVGTKFIGAQHNTTTDSVQLFTDDNSDEIQKLTLDLKKAKELNSNQRLTNLEVDSNPLSASKHPCKRSRDWAQVRPEWGLAKNAAFIIAPRSFSQSLNLEGRCFLHSYEYDQDVDGKILTTILTAPMIVTQWINMQYLFSTLSHTSYGSGSKVTQNITGKIGIMQGNASDLMTGLPLQSIFLNDHTRYHEPQRLMTVVYAPKEKIDPIIEKHAILKKLFGNGWVQLVAIDPYDHKVYFLKRELVWESRNKVAAIHNTLKH